VAGPRECSYLGLANALLYRSGPCHTSRPRSDHRRDEAGPVDEVFDMTSKTSRRRLSASLCASSSSPSPSLPSSPCCPP